MLLPIILIISISLFIFGLYFLIKNYKKGEFNKIYGNMSYVGFCLFVLGIILLMEPIFTKLPQNLSGVLPVAIASCIYIIAGRLLLKPTFIKK